MTTVNTVGTSTGTTTGTSASASATNTNTVNYNSFLQLLVQEMKNQDPTSPTDPTAIKLLSTLDQICIPAVEGGNLDKLAKSGGFRKNSDGNYVNKGAGFQLTLLAFGSNPDTCHVDIIAPVDPQAPARPLVVALHNWATSGHGFSLYRNDKNTQTGQEITTRSWELTDGGKYKALVLTTYRKADGTPAMGNRETSTMLYSEHAAAAPAS